MPCLHYPIIAQSGSYSARTRFLTQRIRILSGFFTFRRKLKLDSWTSSIRRDAARPSLTPSAATGSTLYSFRRHAKTATNSTCENFLPGQTRGPAAHGRNAPCGIGAKTSLPLSSFIIQRLGSHSRAFLPQDAEEV